MAECRSATRYPQDTSWGITYFSLLHQSAIMWVKCPCIRCESLPRCVPGFHLGPHHNCSHPLPSLMVPHDFTPRTGASWHSESQWWNRKSDKALESMSHWKVRKWSFCSEKKKNVANYHLSAKCYYRAVWPAESWLRQWKPRGVSR